ncbi:MAG: hypothetical protein PG981_000152 [Wolbachia endosymbiont of Ctenocephalides orientis wCori]|nr:MAG: hypothetical protein PG981_000152 [Wolbachia endosymbiont of Ctenocephalides orientis wCori]
MTGLMTLGLNGKIIEEKILQKLANMLPRCSICANNKRYSPPENKFGLFCLIAASTVAVTAVGAYGCYAIANFAGAAGANTMIAAEIDALIGALAVSFIICKINDKANKEMVKDPYKSKSTILMDVLIPECFRPSQPQTTP